MINMSSKQDRLIIVFSLLTLMWFLFLLNISSMNAKANESSSTQLFLLSPSPTPTAYKNWSLEQALAINNLQGAWLRKEPNSNSPYFIVLQDNSRVTVRSVPPTYDGYQYWWLVSKSDSKFMGYIEETSLGPVGKANWKIGQQATVNNPKSAWLRPDADSNSSPIAIVPNLTRVTVVAGPKSDSMQWWWQVQVNLKGIQYSGWVEQNSLKEIVLVPGATNGPKVPVTVPFIPNLPHITSTPSTATDTPEPVVTLCTRVHPCSH